MMGIDNYKQETHATEERLQKREILYDLFRNRPMPDDQLLVNLGLYMRSSALTKMLYINELYEKILKIPGIIVEFGVWWGQNLVLYENLRSIYEPFNQTRKIVGFDTFEGYPNLSDKDILSETITKGAYAVSGNYSKYLHDLMDYHEKENVLHNGRRHEIVVGDASQTIDAYLSNHPETLIALAYFDMALYKPTKLCLSRIKPHLIKGSIIALDELNSPDAPGETMALADTWGLRSYRIHKSKLMPGRSYLVME